LAGPGQSKNSKGQGLLIFSATYGSHHIHPFYKH
jgi:hypothetical protein